MKPIEFKAIVTDMEKNLAGDPYDVRLLLADGNSIAGAWQYLKGTDETVIVLSGPKDMPAVYIPISSIMMMLVEPA